MQMIVEFFSRICARTVRMPGKMILRELILQIVRMIIAKILKGEAKNK